MNNLDRLNRMFDRAAEQALSAEGLSSFGRMVRGWNPKAIEQYTKAAESRGVKFDIDHEGTGYFFDPN